ncbi:CCR4-NOT transcription complex subunit 2 isoform X2 [Aethina tumida]|uniref:CCR4-NOT transcription complex subunit 2 isoform X2 n=1 Tax=Aethina tumida TaxID=116153 RepID=UPI00096B2839|nr:CCR4-NOT transcription complex subunit 2 isoform X2 [Aethina tumida]
MTSGMDVKSPKHLYPKFNRPWSDQMCRPQDVDFEVPPEYLVNHAIRLPPINLSTYNEDFLFYTFYNSFGDVLQIEAAEELYNRDWRYHMEKQMWITRVPGTVPTERTLTYEKGTYYFFDPTNWRKVVKRFHLDYVKLENQPKLDDCNLHYSFYFLNQPTQLLDK